jgi:ketosteroid isomerase-like protein
MEDRIEAARRVMRDLDVSEEWDNVVEDGIPPELAALTVELLDAYRRGDVEWLLEHADPDLEITQLEVLPDAKSYHGRDGLIDALLDWPLQWQNFQIEPRRLFAVGTDHLVIAGIHRGRPQMIDIEVEAMIVFLMRWRDGLMTDWNMFPTVAEAVAAAYARAS